MFLASGKLSEEDAVPLAKITIPGLSAIACAVVLLWTCLLGERALMNRAYAERANVMRSIERQHKPAIYTQPVPSVGIHHAQRPLNG